MGSDLRVLFIKESANEVAIILDELRQGKFNPQYLIVDNLAAADVAMTVAEWDIILSDYKAERFDVLAALKLYQKHFLDIPFMVVSDCCGEAVALAMNAGVHDYILTDRLVRLVPAINRALQDAQGRKAHHQAEVALHKSEERLLLALEASKDALWDWNLETGEFYLSPVFYTMLQYQVNEFPFNYDTWTNLLHPDECTGVLNSVKFSLANYVNYEIEMRLKSKSGEWHWVLFKGKNIRNSAGNVVRNIGTIVDINDRKVVEAEIIRYSNRTQALMRIAAEMNSQLDLQGILTTLCKEVCSVLNVNTALVALKDSARNCFKYITGFRVTGDLELAILKELPLELIGLYVKKYGLILEIPSMQSIEDAPNIEFFRTAGFVSGISAALSCNGQLLGALNLYTIKERTFSPDEIDFFKSLADQASLAINNARLFAEVKLNQERMQKLSNQVLNIQEEERRRLSRELHDETGQALTALKIYLDLVRQEIPSKYVSVNQRMLEAVNLVTDLMERMRYLAQELRPPTLEAVGLNLTLDEYCRQFSKLTNIPVIYQGTQIQGIADESEIGLYRFLQEALTNVAKHSAASEVSVKLESTPVMVCLTVEDNGSGFEFQGTMLTGKGKGIGLVGMQERLKMMGGTLEICSNIGTGTRVKSCIPREVSL